MNNSLELLYKLYDHLSQQDNDTKLSIAESNSGGCYCTISSDYCYYLGWGIDIEEAIYDLIDVYVDSGCKEDGETLYIEISKTTTKLRRQELRDKVIRLSKGQPDIDKILTELGLNENE